MKISAFTSPGVIMEISPSSGSWSTEAVALRVTTIISGFSRASISRNIEGRSAAAPRERRFGHRAERERRQDAEALEHGEHDDRVAVTLGRAHDAMQFAERCRGLRDADVRRRLIGPECELHRFDPARWKNPRSIGAPGAPSRAAERRALRAGATLTANMPKSVACAAETWIGWNVNSVAPLHGESPCLRAGSRR